MIGTYQLGKAASFNSYEYYGIIDDTLQSTLFDTPHRWVQWRREEKPWVGFRTPAPYVTLDYWINHAVERRMSLRIALLLPHLD